MKLHRQLNDTIYYKKSNKETIQQSYLHTVFLSWCSIFYAISIKQI